MNRNARLEILAIPEEGLLVHLRGYGLAIAACLSNTNYASLKTILYQQNWNVIKNSIQQQIKALMLQAT